MLLQNEQGLDFQASTPTGKLGLTGNYRGNVLKDFIL